MFLTKIKNLLKPPEKIAANLILNQQLRTSLQATLSPLAISIAPFVMEKIKVKATKKNALSSRLRYNLTPIALTIFLVFALTGIGFLPAANTARAPTFSASLAPATQSGKSNAFIGAPSKTITLPSPNVNKAATTNSKEKSKTKFFFEKIWKFLLTLWK